MRSTARCRGHDDLCAGVGEDRVHPAGRSGDVNGHIGGSGQGDAQQRRDGLRGAVADDRDRVTGSDTAGLQCFGQPGGTGEQIGVGQCRITGDERRARGMLGAGPEELFAQGAVGGLHCSRVVGGGDECRFAGVEGRHARQGCVQVSGQ